MYGPSAPSRPSFNESIMPAIPMYARRLRCAPCVVATALLAALTAPTSAAAQASHDDHAAHGASPYADMVDRAIKALSADEAAGLAAGEGLGMALAAELNGVPGPRHTLDLAVELELTDEQIAAVEAIGERMSGRARALGARILDLEGELDRRFAHGHAAVPDVVRLTAELGALRGELRGAHLVAHIETAAVLDTGQVAAYVRLRGY